MRLGITVGLAVLASTASHALNAADISPQQRALVGLRTASVLVEVLSADATAVGITTERLQAIAELRLRRAGLRVIDESDDSNPHAPYLYVNVQVQQNLCGVLVGLDLQLKEWLFLRDTKPGSRKVVVGATWSDGGIGGSTVSRASAVLEELLLGTLERFENDLLAANPTLRK